MNYFLFISGGELILVMLLALLFFGSKAIPDIARTLGKGLREFKKATNEIKREFNEQTSDIRENIDDVKSTVEKETDSLKYQLDGVSDDINNETEKIKQDLEDTASLEDTDNQIEDDRKADNNKVNKEE